MPTSMVIPGKWGCHTTLYDVRRSGIKSVLAHGEHGFRLSGSQTDGEPSPWHIFCLRWNVLTAREFIVKTGCCFVKTKRWVSVTFGAQQIRANGTGPQWTNNQIHRNSQAESPQALEDPQNPPSSKILDPSQHITYADTSRIPTSGTSRPFDMSTSVTSERLDIPTTGTHRLWEVFQKNLAFYMRQLLV
ncbi:uncharacterized protein C8R40DRAFT_1075412 [Lentinula edodes]|uniref:uncharacterized protein n=1 Tax=Lentinula edodes TaxID=5353 RepID=UPI001E8D9B85|nr:uncharacterized protein C8R40DRAFT_1075412 [Lentinula edodes]KAH7867682.1 hypothetical protein C8R40DRAFT_1075412 [Lentinula edodes]